MSVADVVSVIVRTLHPAVVEVAPRSYVLKKVFPERAGAGWMLYLPRILSTKEVPEAQSLVPVKQDKQQMGTIVVTLKDEIFNVKEPEHVSAANRLEVRLLDQDFLPLLTSL